MALRHLFFDLDGTLARSRTPMSEEHVPLFQKLTERFDVLVTSGTAAVRMRVRLPECSYYLFAENGNAAFDTDGVLLWKNGLTNEQKTAVFSLIERMKRHLDLAVKDETNLVEDRDVQIAYSFIGHNENLEKKEAFDPRGEKRRAPLSVFADEVRQLKEMGVQVLIGGTTTLDFIRENKATNILRLMKQRGWKKENTLYIGDALYPGGNDEVMIGVVPTKGVRSPAGCFALIKELGAL